MRRTRVPLVRVLARLRAAVVAAALLAPLGGCTLGEESEPEPVTLARVEDTLFATALGVDVAASTPLAGGLFYRDVTVGQGAEARAGQQITVRYTGWLSSGQRFDGTTGTATFGPFTLGGGRVIRGWDEGLVGMRVGGRRQLLIPPALGYGGNDYGPIPGNSVLVFTVDLVAVQ